MRRIALLLVLAAMSATCPAFESGEEAPEDVKFVGTRIDPSELEDTDQTAMIATAELPYFLKHKKLECKQGALSAKFGRDTGFTFDDGTFTLDDVLVELAERRKRGEISCFYVTATEYDKSVFDRLKVAMEGGSLFWNEPEKPAE
jgi:hypothetical protein